MIFINLSDIAILNILGVDYRCIINLISKSDAVNVFQNADLTEGKIKKFITTYKMGNEVTKFRDIEVE